MRCPAPEKPAQFREQAERSGATAQRRRGSTTVKVVPCGSCDVTLTSP
jgi:hypothetical protein